MPQEDLSGVLPPRRHHRRLLPRGWRDRLLASACTLGHRAGFRDRRAWAARLVVPCQDHPASAAHHRAMVAPRPALVVLLDLQAARHQALAALRPVSVVPPALVYRPVWVLAPPAEVILRWAGARLEWVGARLEWAEGHLVVIQALAEEVRPVVTTSVRNLPPFGFGNAGAFVGGWPSLLSKREQWALVFSRRFTAVLSFHSF